MILSDIPSDNALTFCILCRLANVSGFWNFCLFLKFLLNLFTVNNQFDDMFLILNISLHIFMLEQI